MGHNRTRPCPDPHHGVGLFQFHIPLAGLLTYLFQITKYAIESLALIADSFHMMLGRAKWCVQGLLSAYLAAHL